MDRRGALDLPGGASLSVPLMWQPTAFTISWWVKPFHRDNWNMGVGNGWGSFMFHTTATGGVCVGTDLSGRIYMDEDLVRLNVWQHFVFTFDNGTGAFYKDGQLLATKSGMLPPNSWDNFALSSSSTPTLPGGLYDEVRLYDRAVSNQEALALYQCRPDGALAAACPPVQLMLTPTAATVEAGDAVQLRARADVAGSALTFDGIDDYVNIADGIANVPKLSAVANSFTMEAWVWPTATHEVDAQRTDGVDGTSGQRYLVFPNHNSGSWGGDHAGAGISVGTNGVSVYEHDGGYMPATLVWPGTLSGWTHIAVVYQDGIPNLYVNGVLVRRGVRSSKPFVHPSLNCGGGRFGYYQGSADELRVWSVARTPQDVAADYERRALGNTAGLAGCWHFDEGADGAVYDATANPVDGFLTRGIRVDPQCGWCTIPAPTTTGPTWVTSTAPVTSADIRWSPSAGLDRATGATVMANPAATTTYTVTAASEAGCTTAQAAATVTVRGGIVPPPSNPSDDLDRNWTFERTFDGNGNVVAETKQFTDALGRPTQAQARNAATQQVFASQTVYSSGGQPVLQTMAAPINNQGFRYKEDFITAGGHPYDYTNFEDSKANLPDAVDAASPGTLGHYFSTNNETEPLTPTTNYPFSLTEPAEGPLGGIKRAAAPGDVFRMGAGHEARGREVPLLKEFDHYLTLRHYFVPGSNDQLSLQRQGTKSISVDGDGRESVVVASKEGQALVSCLTGAQYPPTSVFGFISTSVNPVNAHDDSAPRFLDIHIPATGEHRLSLTIGGRVRIKNLNGGSSVSLTPGGPYADSVDVTVQSSAGNTLVTPAYLLPGFYRLISLPDADRDKQTQKFEYEAEYGNFSYTYYDDAGRVVATVAPNGLASENLVKNPSFDLDNSPVQPSRFWQSEGYTGAVYTETFQGGHSGSYHGTHYVGGGIPARVLTHQIVANLPNGRYTLRAWVKGGGGPVRAFMLARGFGGSVASVTIPNTGGPWGTWIQLELKDLVVTNGQCDVGFESPAGVGFIYFDDVELFRQPDSELPQFVTRNTYDTSSRLLSTESTDEGRTEYVYARDGRIRFSQSALQRPSGRLSYSNYDDVGRVVESGEYTPPAAPSPSSLSLADQVTLLGSQPFQSAQYRAEDAETNATIYSGCCVAYMNSVGKYVQFTVQVPRGGTYALNFNYASGTPNSNQRMTLMVNGNMVGTALFPSTDYWAWSTYATRTEVATLQSGTNTVRLEFGPNDTGAINLAYLQLAEQQNPSPTSTVDVLEERMPTNSLDGARCAQRNRVWYDLPQDGPLNGRTQEFVLGAVAKTSNDNVTTWYSYDELGRVTWVVQDIVGVGVKTLDYRYDFSGNVLEVAYQHGQPDAFHHYYTYDPAQRLTQVYTSPDGATRTLQAKYSYYLHGPLKRVEVANKLQGIDYTYTLQGWLKSINHVNEPLDPGLDSPARNGVPKDLFGLTLDYFSGDYQSRAQAAINPTGLSGPNNPFRYDGTIRAAAWRTPASPDRHQFIYQYDAKSQLAQSTFGKLGISGAFYHFDAAPAQLGEAGSPYEEGGLTYDPNGNMQGLRRSNGDGRITDNFSYQYTPGTNRLSAVHGGGSPSGATVLDYDYDALGQMTRQGDEQGQRYLTYDVTGKTTGVYLDAAHQQPVAEFAYDDRGFRVRKKSYGTGASAGQVQTTTYVRDVAGNVLSIYEQSPQTGNAVQRSEVPLYGSGRLGTLTRLDDGTDDYRYELNDHLGDARVVFHRPATETLTETMELAGVSARAAFQNADLYRTPLASAPSPGFVARLTDTQAPGLELKRTLTVQQGDTITFSAWALLQAGGRAPARVQPYLLLGAANADELPARSLDGQPVPPRAGPGQWLGRLAAGLSFALGKRARQQAALAQLRGSGTLQGWIKYRVLDAQGQEVSTRTEYLLGTGAWERLQTGVRAQQGGTVEVTAGTTGLGAAVYFDDLRVEQTGGLIVQEQHQYAYGSPLVGLNYAVGNKRYRYGYQGQYAEQDPETGFESFELRLYNARIGRWTSYDPKGQYSSPYVGMGNNPVSGIDPDGGVSFGGGGGIFDSAKAFFARIAEGFNKGVPIALDNVSVVGQRIAPAVTRGSKHSLIGIFGRALGVGADAISAPSREFELNQRRTQFFNSTLRDSHIENDAARHFAFQMDRYFAFHDDKIIAVDAFSGMFSPTGEVGFLNSGISEAEIMGSAREVYQGSREGLTNVGQSLSKHGDGGKYGSSILPPAQGGNSIAVSARGETALQNMMKDPSLELHKVHNTPLVGYRMDFRLPSGYGFSYSPTGRYFIGFLHPPVR